MGDTSITRPRAAQATTSRFVPVVPALTRRGGWARLGAQVMNEPMSDPIQARGPRHRGIYLLPNLFTTGAMFAGFYAIVSAIHGNFVSCHNSHHKFFVRIRSCDTLQEQ